MTDRDFKLLVREYFQAKSRAKAIQDERLSRKNFHLAIDLKEKILSELEAFTARDVNELPFKETEK